MPGSWYRQAVLLVFTIWLPPLTSPVWAQAATELSPIEQTLAAIERECHERANKIQGWIEGPREWFACLRTQVAADPALRVAPNADLYFNSLNQLELIVIRVAEAMRESAQRKYLCSNVVVRLLRRNFCDGMVHRVEGLGRVQVALLQEQLLFEMERRYPHCHLDRSPWWEGFQRTIGRWGYGFFIGGRESPFREVFTTECPRRSWPDLLKRTVADATRAIESIFELIRRDVP